MLNNLPKITPVSAKKETGVKVGSKLDISPSLLSGNGVSVAQAAHDLRFCQRNPNQFPQPKPEGVGADAAQAVLKLSPNLFQPHKTDAHQRQESHNRIEPVIEPIQENRVHGCKAR